MSINMKSTTSTKQTSTQNPNGQGPAYAPINLTSYPAEDGGILDAWLDRHGDDWLYVAGFEAWYQWTGSHWQEVSSYALLSQIQELMDEMRQAARRLSKKRQTAWKQATKRTKGRIASIEGMARNVLWKDANELDSAELLNLQNGTLNLKTKVLQPHNAKDLLTYCLPYDHDPAATAPNWTKVLATIDGEVAEFLQEFAGYALTPDTRHEIALWLYGAPGGGKSTVLHGLQTMLGPKAGLLGLAEIENSPFALSNLPGKTLVVATEQPSQFLASTNKLNAIISGERVTVDRKFRDPVEITPRAKVCWALNEFPRVSDANNGIFRRVKVLQFPVIPEDERRPELKQLIAEEGAGILNWALEGLERLQVRNRFIVPDAVKAATEEFARNNDIPSNFVEECCDVEPSLSVQSSELYGAYKAWCIDTGHKYQSTTSVAGDWRRLGFERYRAAGKSYWRGVDITPETRRKYQI